MLKSEPHSHIVCSRITLQSQISNSRTQLSSWVKIIYRQWVLQHPAKLVTGVYVELITDRYNFLWVLSRDFGHNEYLLSRHHTRHNQPKYLQQHQHVQQLKRPLRGLPQGYRWPSLRTLPGLCQWSHRTWQDYHGRSWVGHVRCLSQTDSYFRTQFGQQRPKAVPWLLHQDHLRQAQDTNGLTSVCSSWRMRRGSIQHVVDNGYMDEEYGDARLWAYEQRCPWLDWEKARNRFDYKVSAKPVQLSDLNKHRG